MDPRILDKHRKRIEYLLGNVPSDPKGSLEVQAHWAKYICVIMYGYIENSVQELLRAYATNRCAPEVANYVSTQLGFFQSATVDRIGRLIASFDRRWESDLSHFLDEEHRSAINSVVSNRHRIAHGQDVSVTIHQLSEWYPKVNQVIDHLLSLCA